MTYRHFPVGGQGAQHGAARQDNGDPPIRLAHALFVLWVVATVAWAFYVALLAHHHGWWVSRPVLAGLSVLLPPVVAHVLANIVIAATGNPVLGSFKLKGPR